MKLNKKSIVALCLSLSLMLMSSIGQATAEGGLLLKENAKSPFTGILVPEWQYRALVADVFAKTQFEVELDKCSQQKEELKTKPQTEVLWFGAGAMLATFIILSSKK